jgi:hypothetical protein
VVIPETYNVCRVNVSANAPPVISVGPAKNLVAVTTPVK